MRFLLIPFALLALCGCGLRGDLYLPEAKPATPAAAGATTTKDEEPPAGKPRESR
jgi:predicted small lipoprotein YifL